MFSGQLCIQYLRAAGGRFQAATPFPAQLLVNDLLGAKLGVNDVLPFGSCRQREVKTSDRC